MQETHKKIEYEKDCFGYKLIQQCHEDVSNEGVALLYNSDRWKLAERPLLKPQDIAALLRQTKHKRMVHVV